MNAHAPLLRIEPMRSCLQRRFLLAASALTCLAALVATPCEAGAQASATHTVIIENMRFNPEDLVVHTGDQVTWVNKDFFPHTASALDKAFDSNSIAANASWTYVARRPGEYDYTCSFHPRMKGKLTVQ